MTLKVKAKALEELEVVRTGASIIEENVPGVAEGETVKVTKCSMQFAVGGESLSVCGALTEKEAKAVADMTARFAGVAIANARNADGEPKFEVVA